MPLVDILGAVLASWMGPVGLLMKPLAPEPPEYSAPGTPRASLGSLSLRELRIKQTQGYVSDLFISEATQVTSLHSQWWSVP